MDLKQPLASDSYERRGLELRKDVRNPALPVRHSSHASYNR